MALLVLECLLPRFDRIIFVIGVGHLDNILQALETMAIGAPGAAPTGRRYPSCRLVLTPAAAVDLINQLQRIAAGLVQAGVLKADPPAGVHAGGAAAASTAKN